MATFKVWQRLGVKANDDPWPQQLSLMELLWVASEARMVGQSDISRNAFDALSRRAAGSFMVADLDQRLFRRLGKEGVQAACRGGLSRAGSSCVLAHLATGNVLAAQTEMMRLRRLRGDPAVLRSQEIFALLTDQRRAEAMEIYRALSPGERSLALLGAWYDGDDDKDALREVLRKNLTSARDAPYALQPLARLLGHVPDLSFNFEQQGAKLVALDRAAAFLPGAGTAVLKRVELYDLESSGLLHYWLYDLRRVSGTSDVAGGTWFGMPMGGRPQPPKHPAPPHLQEGRPYSRPRPGSRVAGRAKPTCRSCKPATMWRWWSRAGDCPAPMASWWSTLRMCFHNVPACVIWRSVFGDRSV